MMQTTLSIIVWVCITVMFHDLMSSAVKILNTIFVERIKVRLAEVEAMRRRRTLLLERLPDLKGLDLICWCPLSSPWCHANSLIVRANPVGWQQ